MMEWYQAYSNTSVVMVHLTSNGTASDPCKPCIRLGIGEACTLSTVIIGVLATSTPPSVYNVCAALFGSVYDSVCVCVCMCVCEREGENLTMIRMNKHQ